MAVPQLSVVHGAPRPLKLQMPPESFVCTSAKTATCFTEGPAVCGTEMACRANPFFFYHKIVLEQRGTRKLDFRSV